MSIATTAGIIGFSNDRTSTTPEFALGTQVSGAGNNSYTYALAASTIAAAGTTNLTAGFATTAGTTYTHDVASPGVPSGSYFWAKKAATPF